MANDVNVKIGIDQTSLVAGLNQAQATIRNAAGGMALGFDGVRSSIDRVTGSLRGMVSIWAAWRAATDTIRLADQMAQINSRMSSLVGSTRGAADVSAQLFEVAQRLQVPYKALGDTFARLYPAVQQLGGGIKETARLTEILSITAKLSGASAEEAAAAQLQFAQALGSGRLQGDELRSILENNQVLARGLAGALGTTIGQLRTMGAAGQLTSEKIGNALLGLYDAYRSQSEELAYTVGGAFGNIENSYARLIATLSNSTGAMAGAVGAFRGLAQVLDVVAQRFANTEAAANGLTQRTAMMRWADTVARGVSRTTDVIVALNNGLDFATNYFSTIWSIAKRLVDLDFSGSMSELTQGLARGRDLLKESIDLARGKGGIYEAVLAAQAAAGQAAGGSSSGSTRQLSGGTGGAGIAKLNSADKSYAAWILSLMQAEGAAADKAARDMERLAAQQRQADAIRLDSAKARIVGQINAEQAGAEAAHAAGEISAEQLLALQTQFEERRFAVQRQALAEKLALDLKDPDKNPAERARIMAQIEALETNHLAKLTDLQRQAAAQQSEFGAAFKTGLQGGIESFANGIANGTIRISNSWRTMMQGLAQITTSALARIGAEWLVNELFRTRVTQTQAAIRTAAETASASASVAANAGAASTSILNDAWAAMAGAYKAIAGIPVVGPALAPAAAAASFAAVAALANNVLSASGGFDVPAGLNPVTQLHAREMVLPASIADAVRRMTDGGGSDRSVGGNLTVHIHALDGASVERVLVNNPDELARGIRAAAKKAGWRI